MIVDDQDPQAPAHPIHLLLPRDVHEDRRAGARSARDGDAAADKLRPFAHAGEADRSHMGASPAAIPMPSSRTSRTRSVWRCSSVTATRDARLCRATLVSDS